MAFVFSSNFEKKDTVLNDFFENFKYVRNRVSGAKRLKSELRIATIHIINYTRFLIIPSLEWFYFILSSQLSSH